MAVAGCSVIKTTQQQADLACPKKGPLICPVAQDSPERNLDLKRVSHGANYFLPLQRLKFEASRSFKKVGDIKKQKAEVEQNLQTVEKSIEDTEQRIKVETKDLETLTKTDPKKTKEKEFSVQKQRTVIDLLGARLKTLKNDKARLTKAKSVLDEALAVAPNDDNALIPQYKFDLKLQAPEPDPAFALQADFRHMPWRDDDLKLSVTEDGLLSSSKTESTDQTGEILVQIAKTVAFFVSGTPSVPQTVQFLKGPDDKSRPTVFAKPFVYKPIFDPTNPPEIDDINVKLLTHHLAPYCLRVTGVASNKTSSPHSVGIEKNRGVPGLVYRSRLPYKVEIIELTDPDPIIKDSAGLPNELCGVQTRSLKDTNATMKPSGHPIDSSIVLLPNKGPVGLIPFKAGSFVKTVHDVEFKNGLLTKWDTNKPSEILAIVRVPLDIVDGIFEGLSKLVPFQTKQVTNESDLLKAQAELFKSQTELLEAQRSLEAASAAQ